MNMLNSFKLSASAFAIIAALSACTSSGGGGGGDTTTSAPVQKSGNVLADGYLQFATVCLDTTKNNSCADEDTTVKTQSNATGDFTLSALASQYQQFAILAESNSSTIDDNGAITEKLVLSTPPGKTEPTTGDITVSPLTTIVQGYLQANLGLSTAAAEQQIKDNLGVESSSVSLFDDYVEQLKQLAASAPKPIASGAIATGVLTNAQAYTLFNQVAQVTTASIQQAIVDVVADAAGANGVANINIATQLDSLIAIVIEDVVNNLPQLVIAIDNLAPDAVFNPVALVNSIGLTIDLTTLADAITNQEQINTATATGMQAILQDGLNFIRVDFFNETSSFQHEKITLNTAGDALVGTFTQFDPNNPTAGFVTAPTNNNNSSRFYLDATTGWTQEPANDITGSAVTINADGSADIVSVIDSFSISGAVSDVAGKRIADYAPLELQPSLTNSIKVFAAGAKAIRFSGTNLTDSYRLDTFSFVQGTTGTATILSDIITTAAFNSADGLGFTGQTLNCQQPNFSSCIGVEFIDTTSSASGAVGTSGSAKYYLVDKSTSPQGVTLLADTGTWSVISFRTETLLKSTFPIAIRNRLVSFGDNKPENGILFSQPKNSQISTTVLRGGFDLAGESFVDTDWAFNDKAAADVEGVIISDLNSSGASVVTVPGVTDTSSLVAGNQFTINLFQNDPSLGTLINVPKPGATFTRGTDFTTPTGSTGSLDLVLNIFASAGVVETPVEIDRITVDSIDPTKITSATFNQATGIATGFTDIGTISVINGELAVNLVNVQNGEVASLRIVPIQAITDPSGSNNQVDVIVIFTIFAADGTSIKADGVVTGTLIPTTPPV